MNADDFRALTECWARVMEENRDRLIELDSVVGDSDLGLTMSDGFRAAACRASSTNTVTPPPGKSGRSSAFG